MKTQGFNNLGTSRYWWLVLITGLLLVIGGFAYWFWPAAGFAVASLIFGWLLVATGIVQLCVSAGRERPKGWGWWLTGGVINLFVGFLLVGNIFLAEAVLPYFLAFVFLYAGIMTLASAFGGRGSGWWLYLINGILLIIIGGFFCAGGYLQEMNMVSLLASLAFVYWGFVVAAFAYDLKPHKIDEE